MLFWLRGGTLRRSMYFVVNRRWGPAWDRSRPLREQEAWTEHASFMDRLVDEDFVMLGGPLGEGALLIVNADSEDAVHRRFADDPWSPMQMLTTAAVDRWEILLGQPGA